MKLIIYTSFDCLLKTNASQETLETNQHITFDEIPTSLSVYPLGKNGRIAFNIDFEKPNSNFYRIIEKDDKTILFLIDGVFAENVRVYDIDCVNKKCLIEVGKNKVSFQCGINKKNIRLPYENLNSKCGHFFHIAYLYTKNENNETLIAYNTNNNNAKVFKGDKIELMDDGFSVLSSFDGYSSIKSLYIVTKEGLKLKQNDFKTLNTPFPQETIFYRFLSAIKLGDIETAREFLSLELKESLTNEEIKRYFGNISYIFPIDMHSCFSISNGKSVIYHCTLQNGQISDITDNNN